MVEEDVPLLPTDNSRTRFVPVLLAFLIAMAAFILGTVVDYAREGMISAGDLTETKKRLTTEFRTEAIKAFGRRVGECAADDKCLKREISADKVGQSSAIETAQNTLANFDAYLDHSFNLKAIANPDNKIETAVYRFLDFEAGKERFSSKALANLLTGLQTIFIIALMVCGWHLLLCTKLIDQELVKKALDKLMGQGGEGGSPTGPSNPPFIRNAGSVTKAVAPALPLLAATGIGAFVVSISLAFSVPKDAFGISISPSILSKNLELPVTLVPTMMPITGTFSVSTVPGAQTITVVPTVVEVDAKGLQSAVSTLVSAVDATAHAVTDVKSVASDFKTGMDSTAQSIKATDTITKSLAATATSTLNVVHEIDKSLGAAEKLIQEMVTTDLALGAAVSKLEKSSAKVGTTYGTNDKAVCAAFAKNNNGLPPFAGAFDALILQNFLSAAKTSPVELSNFEVQMLLKTRCQTAAIIQR